MVYPLRLQKVKVKEPTRKNSFQGIFSIVFMFNIVKSREAWVGLVLSPVSDALGHLAIRLVGILKKIWWKEWNPRAWELGKQKR